MFSEVNLGHEPVSILQAHGLWVELTIFPTAAVRDWGLRDRGWRGVPMLLIFFFLVAFFFFFLPFWCFYSLREAELIQTRKSQGEMALLLSHPTSLSPSCSSFQSFTISAHTFSRLPKRSLSLRQRSVDGVWLHSPISFGERSAIIVRASSDLDAGEPEITNMPRESAEEASSVVENLPLESKQQMILEQRQKMKLAKKIRLRRKRLLRKRRMRKKGRWPPSKMRKLKNV